MENLVIPGWAVFIITTAGGAFIGWMIWLTNRTLQNDKDIAITDANLRHIPEELDKIYEAIGENNKSTMERLDKMDQKIDLFLSNEMQLLKQHIINR